MLSHLIKLFGQRPPKRTPINELKVGRVQSIEGEAIAIGAPIPAPFSGALCATLSVVHEYGTLRETIWDKGPYLADNHLVFGRLFYVRDQSGLVRVERGARSEFFAHTLESSKIPKALREQNLARFRQIFEGDPSLAEFNKAMLPRFALGANGPKQAPLASRHSERCVAQGRRVRVVGLVRNSGEPLPADAVVGFRDAPTMLELAPPSKGMLRITRIAGATKE